MKLHVRTLCECGCGELVAVAESNNTKHGYVKGEPFRFRRGHHLRGAMHHNWRGGRKAHTRGYVRVLSPGHPRASEDGYVLEHILVVERALGKFLDRRHVVHHVNGNRSDNRSCNLIACEDQAYHNLLEQRIRRIAQARQE